MGERITREDLAETITDVLVAVEGHDVSECSNEDISVMLTLLRCANVFLANDEFDFIDIETTP
jgi:hypothetical protein